MTIYLDYSATTPVLPEVAELVYRMMTEEFGNAGSRTHEYGSSAKSAVEIARAQVAEAIGVEKSDVIFTSGATESNNIAILGLREFAESTGKKHIITTKIEHKAVLEPIEHLRQQGFEITYLDANSCGQIEIAQLEGALREDTALVSIMHVNNETGVIQPLEAVCSLLEKHEAYLHVDAAQSFGKLSDSLENKRIDFVSASGHKLYAPKGIGALILRRRGYSKPPLKPLYFGGGQEKGLRPGTLATHLIAGFGLACEIAKRSSKLWIANATKQKQDFIEAMAELDVEINGQNSSPFMVNLSFPGVNSEAALVKLKRVIAVSNGSACTASSYTPSHVLTAMGMSEEKINGAIRVSFGINKQKMPYEEIKAAIRTLL